MLGFPPYDSLPQDKKKNEWDLARALIEAYKEASKPTCIHCGKTFPWTEGYRCYDCKGFICEADILGHFGPGHKPHR